MKVNTCTICTCVQHAGEDMYNMYNMQVNTCTLYSVHHTGQCMDSIDTTQVNSCTKCAPCRSIHVQYFYHAAEFMYTMKVNTCKICTVCKSIHVKYMHSNASRDKI